MSSVVDMGMSKPLDSFLNSIVFISEVLSLWKMLMLFFQEDLGVNVSGPKDSPKENTEGKMKKKDTTLSLDDPREWHHMPLRSMNVLRHQSLSLSS